MNTEELNMRVKMMIKKAITMTSAVFFLAPALLAPTLTLAKVDEEHAYFCWRGT
jgi:hypothetical protein